MRCVDERPREVYDRAIKRGRRPLGLVATVLAFALLPAAAHAATIKVNTNEDLASGGHKCSLREAVSAANTGTAPAESDCTPGPPGSNVIELPGTTYLLELEPNSELVISAPLTISAEGATPTVIEQTKDYRVFNVQSRGVVISGVTVLKGYAASGSGGDVLIGGNDSLTLTDSKLEEGFASMSGAGVYVGEDATATIGASTISANGANDDGGGVYLAEGATARVEKSSLSNDIGEEAGGGVFVESNAHATIDESSILDDKVDDEGGGGIANLGTATLNDTTVDANESEIGGGIESVGTMRGEAELTLTGGAVSGNTAREEGGGIASSGRLTVTGTTISGNSASTGSGGGLASFGEPSTLSDVKISGNSAPDAVGGGIVLLGPLELINSQLEGNEAKETGGGLYFEADNTSQHLDVEGSTIGPGNKAAQGDGVYAVAPMSEKRVMDLTRSTVSENLGVGSTAGGGLYIGKGIEATLHDVTVAGNFSGFGDADGDNLYAEAGAKLVFENTLVANPFAGGNCELTSATVSSLGGDEAYGPDPSECRFTDVHDSSSDSELTGAELHPLASNGGATETMALGAGALPVGTGFGCEASDQRGVRRPHGSCDSGAYQVDPPAPVLTITSGASGTIYDPNVSFTFTSTSAEEPTTFQCSIDGDMPVLCTSPFNAGPLSFGAHTFTVKASDSADLLSGEASRTFTVERGLVTCACAPPGGRRESTSSQTRPIVSNLVQSHTRWREGSALARISRAVKKPPQGTIFSFTLNEPATLKLSFTQPAPGRSVRGHCVAQTKHNRARRACTRTLTVAALAPLQGLAGADHVRFQGRLSSTKTLKPGRYTLVLSASADGLTSTSRSLTFTILG